MATPEPRIREWFSEDEFERCPRCKTNSALNASTGAVVCTECGLVRLGGEAGAADSLQSQT